MFTSIVSGRGRDTLHANGFQKKRLRQTSQYPICGNHTDLRSELVEESASMIFSFRNLKEPEPIP